MVEARRRRLLSSLGWASSLREVLVEMAELGDDGGDSEA